jgi:hypothetical protein
MALYVKNLSMEDFEYFSKGLKYTLKAESITLLDETKVSFDNIKRTWGPYVKEIPTPTAEQIASAEDMTYGKDVTPSVIEDSLAMGKGGLNVENLSSEDYEPGFEFVVASTELGGKLKVDTANGDEGVFIFCPESGGNSQIIKKIHSTGNGSDDVGIIHISR